MYPEFSLDEIHLTAAAVTLSEAANKLKRIGDCITLNIWSGKVPEEILVPHFWPYLMDSFNKLSPYKDFRADIVYVTMHSTDFTAIKITYITAKQSIDIVKANDVLRGE